MTDFAQLGDLQIDDRTSVFGSGGMRSKVGAAEMASEAGISAVICNGTSPGTLLSAAGGERRAAPVSPPGDGRTSSFKLWLKYAKPARGRLVVDPGAARVLRESGSSLLPVGIAAVEGSFEPGDAIDVATDGETIGKGISEYSSRELQQVIGMQSAAGAGAAPARRRRGRPPRPLRPPLIRLFLIGAQQQKGTDERGLGTLIRWL